MQKKKTIWLFFEILLVLIILLVHIYIALTPKASMLNWYRNDDAFYYFKVAENIVTGQGVTFDGINSTNGFHPLWMLVCIPVFWLAQFNPMLPLRILIIIAGLLSAGTGILLFHLLRRMISPVTAAYAAVLWTGSWSIQSRIVQNGLESNLSALFIALLLFLVVTDRKTRFPLWQQIVLGLIAGLTVLARLDNIYLVLLVGVWFILDGFTPYLRTVIVSDLGLIFCAGLLSFFIRLGTGPLYIDNSVSLPWLLVLNFIFVPISLFLFGLYRPAGETLSIKYLARIILALSLSSILSGGILIVLQKISVDAAFPRSVILINGSLLLVGIFLTRALTRWALVEKGHLLVNEAAMVVLVKIKWRQITRRGFAYFAPLVVIMGTYMSWSWLFVGTPLPVSGQVKHWWGNLPAPVYGRPVQGGPALFGFSDRGAWELLVVTLRNIQSIFQFSNKSSNWLGFIVSVLLGAGLVFLVIKNWQGLPGIVDRFALPAWFWGIYAQIFYYTTTSYVHMRPWYWSAEMLFLVVLFAVLLETLWKASLKAEGKQGLGAAILALAGLSTLAIFVRTVWLEFPYTTDGGEHEYITDARSLESMTESGSLIGMTGSGSNGYFVEGRTIVNLDGLINSPEYFYSLQAGQGAVYLDRLGLDYVYGSSTMLTASDPYWQLLDGHLEFAETRGEYTLYRYLPTP